LRERERAVGRDKWRDLERGRLPAEQEAGRGA